ENWFDNTARTNAATQMTAVSTGDRFFTRAVNLEHDQRIDSGQYFNKIFVQIACARVAMRLINHHQTALGPTVTHSFNDRRDLTRMVAVVINQHGATSTNSEGAVNLKTTTDSLKISQPILNSGIA